MNANKRARRLTVAARRRIICVVIALAVAELAVEVLVTHKATISSGGVPAIAIVTGLLYLWSTRGRS